MLNLAKVFGCGALLLVSAGIAQAAQEPDANVQSVSTRMDIVRGKPYVMVMVNGHGPYRFLVDTGTGAEALVTGELADELQLPTIGRTRLTDPSRQGDQKADVVWIDSIDVGGVVFSDLKAVRHQLYGEDSTCQGLLGFTLFKDYLMTLDYPNQRLTLSAGELMPDGESSVLPFRMPDGVPIAPLRIGDLRVEALFDSGGTGLSLPEQLARQLKFAVDPVDFGRGESLSSRFLIKEARLGTEVQVGRYTFPEPYVEINAAFPEVNLGSCPMQNFAITFDQANLLVRLRASQSIFHLGESPSLRRMQNAPDQQRPPEQALVPVG